MRICFAFLGAFLVVKLASASSLPDYPFLFETGSADIEIAPDMATIDISISHRGRDPSKIFSVVNSSVAVILDDFTKFKVPQADIDASEVQRTVDLSRTIQDKSAPTNYVISRHVRVRLRDLSIWPVLMADLAKIENIESLSSDFQTSAQKSIGEELELRAARNAEARARRIAESFGRKLGAVMAISRTPFNALERTFTEGESGNYAPPPPFIPPTDSAVNLHVPAKITLSRSLNVLFKLD